MIRHLLDLMHCEKNLCENIMKTVWGLKDTLKVRLDLKEASIRPKLHPKPGGNDTIILPVAPYVLSKVEKSKFIKTIRNLKTPSNYVGQLSKRITIDEDLRGLKSHDYHIMMQQILLLCVRTLLTREVRAAIIHTSKIFVRLCAKFVDPSTMEYLMEETAVTMYMLEKVFPPTFLMSCHICRFT